MPGPSAIISMAMYTKKAAMNQKELLRVMLQTYLEELSRLPGEIVNYKDETGVYHYPYLDAYWLESEKHPYVLYSDDSVAGFALVRLGVNHWEMAEYYVRPEFRRMGIGEGAAIDIFEATPLSRAKSYAYTPYSLVKSIMAWTFSGLASSGTTPGQTMRPPSLPTTSMSFLQ